MSNSEAINHDLLLVIVSMLFIIFVTGCAVSANSTEQPIIIP